MVCRYVMRLPEVIHSTGYKRSYIYKLMRQGEFPQSKRIGLRAVGWDSEEVSRWVDIRLGGSSSNEQDCPR